MEPGRDGYGGSMDNVWESMDNVWGSKDEYAMEASPVTCTWRCLDSGCGRAHAARPGHVRCRDTHPSSGIAAAIWRDARKICCLPPPPPSRGVCGSARRAALPRARAPPLPPSPYPGGPAGADDLVVTACRSPGTLQPYRDGALFSPTELGGAHFSPTELGGALFSPGGRADIGAAVATLGPTPRAGEHADGRHLRRGRTPSPARTDAFSSAVGRLHQRGRTSSMLRCEGIRLRVVLYSCRLQWHRHQQLKRQQQ
eukprot:gene12166-biopygen5178